MRWRERQDEGRREEKEAGGTDATGAQTRVDGGRRTEGERRGEERQQLGYFAATLTEEVTVKYTAVARRAGGLHESETSSSSARAARAHIHTSKHTHLTYSTVFNSGGPLNEGTQPAEPLLSLCAAEGATTGSGDNEEEEEEAAAGGAGGEKEKEEVVYLDDGGRLERMPRRVASLVVVVIRYVGRRRRRLG